MRWLRGQVQRNTVDLAENATSNENFISLEKEHKEVASEDRNQESTKRGGIIKIGEARKQKKVNQVQ